MRARAAIALCMGVFGVAFAFSGAAQQGPCPVPVDNPVMRPPGPPPDFHPHVVPGPTPESPAKIEFRKSVPLEPMDVSTSLLAGWKLEATMPGPPVKVTRIFSRPDGSWARFEEVDNAYGSGQTGMPRNAKVGSRPATTSPEANRGRCLSTFLLWPGDKRSYSLEVSGPFDAAGQRALAESIATGLANSAP